MTGLSKSQAFLKRMFDLVVAIPALFFLLPLIATIFIIASLDTRSFGFFLQRRIGFRGRPFLIIKFKTMMDSSLISSPIASLNASRVTVFGNFLRKYKLDELPQLFNIIAGQMSFVGPRPDVPGYADRLKSVSELYLSIRPGVTGPASIKYANEEEILSASPDPRKHNDEVIWPDKVKINLQYIKTWSLRRDIGYIFKTVFN